MRQSTNWMLGLACVQLSMLSGCSPQHATEQIVVGADNIWIDGSSGSVKIFHAVGAGQKTELRDTGAAQRLGWTVIKIGADRLRLATKDVGSFDIFRDGADWLVVPTGTSLSPSRTKAVKLTADGINVRAQIGGSKPPYTDIWVSEEAIIAAARTDQLTVKWTTGDLAQVQDATGRVVACLHAQDPAAAPNVAPPAKQ